MSKIKEDLKKNLILIKTKCGSIALGNGSCYICGCEISKKGMTVHHLWYVKGDVIYKNYPQTDDGRLIYYTELFPLIKKNPKRFMYMCGKCHYSLEKLCHFGDKKFNKLCQARKMTVKIK